MDTSTGITIHKDSTTPDPLNININKNFHFHNKSGGSISIGLPNGLVENITSITLEDNKLSEFLPISPNASGDYSFTITHHSGGLGGGTGKIHVND